MKSTGSTAPCFSSARIPLPPCEDVTWCQGRKLSFHVIVPSVLKPTTMAVT